MARVLVQFAAGCSVPLDVPIDPFMADHGVAQDPRGAYDLLRAPTLMQPFLHPGGQRGDLFVRQASLASPGVRDLLCPFC